MKLTLAGAISSLQYILLGVLLCGAFPNAGWIGRIILLILSIILVLIHDMVCEIIQKDLEVYQKILINAFFSKTIPDRLKKMKRMIVIKEK